MAEVAYYEPNINDRIRIAIRFGEVWRPIFWFQIGKDGSIYLGPRYEKISTLRKGSKPIQEGKVTVKYAEGQEVSNPHLLKSSKISFHASGIVNAFGDQSFTDSVRTIKEQRELCRILFQHPSKYEPIQTIRNRDVCLNYLFDENCPLCGLIFIAPLSIVKLVQIPSTKNQVSLMFPFSGMKDVPDYLIQFILYHGVAGVWPPYTYLLFETKGVSIEEENQA